MIDLSKLLNQLAHYDLQDKVDKDFIAEVLFFFDKNIVSNDIQYTLNTITVLISYPNKDTEQLLEKLV